MWELGKELSMVDGGLAWGGGRFRAAGLPLAHGRGMELGGGHWRARNRRESKGKGQEARWSVPLGFALAPATWRWELWIAPGNRPLHAHIARGKFCTKRTRDL